ncbi:MAG: YnbE family lipoprotein [Parasphingorhabdus sp.]
MSGYDRQQDRSRLTDRLNNAIRQCMKSYSKAGLILGVLGLNAVLAGCVQVSAPDKPIVINLNINIKQEVVYRLNDDAQELINSDAEIF